MSRLTVGFFSTWPIYQGTTLDQYAHSLLQGISTAARQFECNLILGCGFSVTGKNTQRHIFWPVSGPGVDFIPVGPWNTDGLIIVPDELTQAQLTYVHDLQDSGFPVVFTTSEAPGPLVKVDNAQGIYAAFSHLLEHQHHQIAFIAGNRTRGGDSEERLQAYRDALSQAGLPFDGRLVAYGEHTKDGGMAAARQILASGAPFSALIASNDLSGLGAIDVLKASGRRIPEDVAVIGFDDILDARSLSPSLTTIRLPSFSLGYQAVTTLLEHINGRLQANARVIIPTRLIIRQSCGCRPRRSEIRAEKVSLPTLAREMAEASLIEAHNALPEDLEAQSAKFLEAFVESIRRRDDGPVLDEIGRILGWTEERGEDPYVWQTATAVLLQRLHSLLELEAKPDVDMAFATSLLDRSRLEISDHIQRQATRSMLNQMEMMAQLSQLTAEMLTAMNIDQSAEILARHIATVGIENVLAVLYEPHDEGPADQGTILFSAGLPANLAGVRFSLLEFPFPGIYPPEQLLRLTILPLYVDNENTGFVAFTASKPEMCASIVHNLGAAVRNSRLYQEAIEGRRLAEEATRLKSRFLSMVSHELRTPLSLIVGLSEMALHHKTLEVRDIEQIHLSAQHLARLIGDVLDLASSEAGQLRILREPHDLGEELYQVAKLGEEMARKKGLAWKVNLPENGPWVIGDRTRLRQVMLNLISNAVKFTSRGLVQLDVTFKHGRASVSVSDSGIGIPPADLDRVFTEFYRIERAEETGVSGFGLGLAITRQLIEQHGGKIEVHSPGNLGCGTTFTFTLPMISVAALRPKPVSPIDTQGPNIVMLGENIDPGGRLRTFLEERGYELYTYEAQVESEMISADPRLLNQTGEAPSPILGQPGKPQTILIVDDDPGILDIHKRMVEQTGRQVTTAANGREVLEILSHTIPDLILLDLMMPEMDGFAVLEILRARESTRNIPIIILTARLLSESDLERLNHGVNSILSKGIFSLAETLEHIETALDRRNPLGGATREIIHRAMAYIHNHYAEALTREDIGSYAGISPDYLTDCFRQELGITPSTYIRRYRIRQACELLRSTNQSITQVAMSVGFSDSAHFTRTFCREVGIPPKAYRRQGGG